MEKSPFFIRPYHVREEDKKVTDNEMRCFYYLGILKEGFPYIQVWLCQLVER